MTCSQVRVLARSSVDAARTAGEDAEAAHAVYLLKVLEQGLLDEVVRSFEVRYVARESLRVAAALTDGVGLHVEAKLARRAAREPLRSRTLRVVEGF